MKTVLSTIVVVTGLSSLANAGTVFINPPTTVGDPFSGQTVARATMMFTPPRAAGTGAGTSSSTSATDPSGPSSMREVWFSFLLSNTPGKGWSLSLTPDAPGGANGVMTPKVWRQDVDIAYNSLVIRTQAAAANLARLDLASLQFSAPGQNITGAFPDLDVSTTGFGQTVSESRAAALADVDLGRIEWSLSGRIGASQASRGARATDEIGLWFTGVHTNASIPANGQFNVVPLPTTAGLGAAGLLAIAALRRRRA